VVGWPDEGFSGARRRRAGRLAVGLAIAGLWAAAGGDAAAGPIACELTVGTRIDEPRAGAPAPFATTAGLLAPRLVIRGTSGPSGLELSALRRFELRQGSGGGSPTLVTNPLADDAFLRAKHEWSEYSGVVLDGRYRQTRDPMELDDRAVALGRGVTEWEGSAAGSSFRAEGGYRIRRWSYEAPGQADATTIAWTASFLPLHHEHDAWLAGWRQRQLEIGSSWVLRSRQAVVGYRRSLLPRLSARIEVGRAELMSGDGARRQGPALVIGLDPPGIREGVISGELAFQRDFPTAVTAELDRTVGTGRVTARWEALADVGGGMAGEPAMTRRLSLGAQDTLDLGLVIGFDSGFAQARSLRSRARLAESLRVSGWLARSLSPWLAARGGCSYLHWEGSQAARAQPLHRLRWEAELTVAR
jgi:hypothetical protein